MRTETIKLYQFKELSEEAQEKVLEKFYEINIDYEWWEQDDLLCPYQDKIFSGAHEMYFNLDRGSYISFPKLGIDDQEKFCELVKVPKKLRKKFDFYITYKNYGAGGSANSLGWEIKEEVPGEISSQEEEELEKIEENFNKLLNNALSSLQNTYEYLTSKNAIAEAIEANEYEFLENGERY